MGIAVVAVVMMVGLRSAPFGSDPQPIPSRTLTPSVPLHIESFLASLPDRPTDDVLDIKAEELAMAEAVVSDYPDRVESLCLLASVHQGHGNVPQAEERWRQALRIDPSRPQIHEELGLMAQGQDRLDQAIAYWRQGIEADPRTPNLRWYLANALVLEGHLEGTVPLLETECTLTPGAARNYFLLGQIHFKQEAFEQSRVCYDKALELQSNYFNAYYGLGKVYARLGQSEKAEACMQEFLRRKKAQEAESERIALDETPFARLRAAGFYRQAYRLYGSAGQDATRWQLLERAVQMDPNDARNWEMLASCHYQHNRLQEALAGFEKARELDPNNPFLYINIAALNHGMKRPERAESLLKEAVGRFQENALVHAELARFYLHTRTNLPASQLLAQRAAALDPSAAHLFVLGRACAANGNLDGAAKAIEHAIALDPNNPQYKDFHAYVRSRK
jgi:tetratricopeptide (TPR) repeat protein